MARILYFPTHEPLEYDEVSLLQSLGHTVFSLGIYCPASPSPRAFRPAITFDPNLQPLIEAFRREGCSAVFLDLARTVLTPGFVELFDAVIVVQDLQFTIRNWQKLKSTAVIWRTVGQAIDHCEAVMQPYRDQGLKIVRWCAREARTAGYIGHDAIIRGYKDPSEFGPWHGGDRNIVTFSNHYRQRYPVELAFFERAVAGLDYAIGGIGNDGVANAIGMIDFAEMKRRMAAAGAYFYCHGSVVPYTLNFIEAWMTGIPMVGLHRDVDIPGIDMQYNEVNEFISDGDNGFLVKSEAQAREVLVELLRSEALAQRIGAAGRRSAELIFGKDKIADDWQRFLASLGLQASPAATSLTP